MGQFLFFYLFFLSLVLFFYVADLVFVCINFNILGILNNFSFFLFHYSLASILPLFLLLSILLLSFNSSLTVFFLIHMLFFFFIPYLHHTLPVFFFYQFSKPFIFVHGSLEFPVIFLIFISQYFPFCFLFLPLHPCNTSYPLFLSVFPSFFVLYLFSLLSYIRFFFFLSSF